MVDLVLRDDRERVATLTLNRPDKMNALTVAMFEELNAHVAEIATSRDVSAVVLRGAGKCFSAGNDLGTIGTAHALPEPHFHARVIERLADLPQPVIAAVHGHCYTGALELALAADIIVASESAKFADTHARWALMPIWGMSQRLPRRIGPAKTREMMLTSRTYSGRDAERMGLANFCVADDVFDAELDRLTRDIAATSSFTHAAVKRLLAQTDGLPLKAGLAYEIARSEGVGPDAKDRIAAFARRGS